MLIVAWITSLSDIGIRNKVSSTSGGVSIDADVLSPTLAKTLLKYSAIRESLVISIEILLSLTRLTLSGKVFDVFLFEIMFLRICHVTLISLTFFLSRVL